MKEAYTYCGLVVSILVGLFVLNNSKGIENTTKDKVTKKGNRQEICESVFNAVGNTPLIKIESLSRETGCTILGKAEFMNPGGSAKDRIAKYIIEQAERDGLLSSGSTIIEATAGSTGISLALLGKARGYNVQLFLPNNCSEEKINFLQMLGAKLEIVPIVGMNVPTNFMHLAYEHSLVTPNTYYVNQFNNSNNFFAHYHNTAPEIWEQTKGKVDGVVLASGTGGTLAGLSAYLKEKNSNLQAYLIDPPGSGLFNLVKHGIMFDQQDTLTVEKLGPRSFYEGIGINRQTENFAKAKLDGAFKGTEMEGVEMAYYLLRNDGLFIGASSALNCVGAVKLAKKLGPGHTIVTVLADGGQRYVSKLYNKQWLEDNKLVPSHSNLDFISH